SLWPPTKRRTQPPGRRRHRTPATCPPKEPIPIRLRLTLNEERAPQIPELKETTEKPPDGSSSGRLRAGARKPVLANSKPTPGGSFASASGTARGWSRDGECVRALGRRRGAAPPGGDLLREGARGPDPRDAL